MQSLTVEHDGLSLNVVDHFGIDPLREHARAGGWLVWINHGLRGKVPNAILRTAVDVYEMYHPKHYDPNQRIERQVPGDVGVIRWDQVKTSGR